MTEKYPELKELFFYLHDVRLRKMLIKIIEKDFVRKKHVLTQKDIIRIFKKGFLTKKKVKDVIEKEEIPTDIECRLKKKLRLDK